MPMPKVTTSVEDLTTRVTSTGTYNTAVVVAAKKGPIDEPILVTSQTDFLERFTPNEFLEIGWDTALYEAYIYLGEQSNLYVVRAANTTGEVPALYGGCHIRTYKSAKANESLEKGFVNVEDHVPVGEGGVPDQSKKHFDTPIDVIDFDNDAMIIYGSSQGKFNNDLAVTIVTDPDKVKLDGAFIINVYKNKALVETHTCSLDPSMKNGYGVNCYAETVLNASKYIRADVNDNEDILLDVPYELNIVGTVDFENEVVTAIKAETSSQRIDLLHNHAYNKGGIIRVSDVEDAKGYYKCTVAGRTTRDDAATSYADEQGKYKTEVEDGTATFELLEIIKEHKTDTAYEAGDIIATTKDNKTALFYRAMADGTTGVTIPTFGADIYTITDGTITWVAQIQTEQLSETTAYTQLAKEAGSSFDLGRYNPYKDEYLSTTLELRKTTVIDNPVGYVDRAKGQVLIASEEKAINYEAKYTGEARDAHYCLPKATTDLVWLAGGADGAEPTNAERIRALKKLQNLNGINIQLIMDAGNTTPEYQKAIDEVCTYRDNSCKGIISTPYANEMGMITGDAHQDILDYRRNTLNVNTRNLELYTTHQLVYDEFNDRNIYVSPSCFVAARIMAVAQEYGWHWAAAGYNRGVINSLDVANTFDPVQTDDFSDNQINTIIKEPGMGNVIFDELTLLNRACDLQDAHISRYVDVYLRPNIKTALKSFLFEFNDEQTRNLVNKMLKTFMDPEVSSRALYDYKIVCDETNNRPRDIQNNIMNVWIFIQVVKLAKFIPVKFIVSPYGVSFDDLGYNG